MTTDSFLKVSRNMESEALLMNFLQLVILTSIGLFYTLNRVLLTHDSVTSCNGHLEYCSTDFCRSSR